MTDLASLMADEPVMTDIHTSVGARSAVMARNDLRRELRPLLEAREQALLARVAELENRLHCCCYIYPCNVDTCGAHAVEPKLDCNCDREVEPPSRTEPLAAAREFNQDSIAWTEGKTEFLEARDDR